MDSKEHKKLLLQMRTQNRVTFFYKGIHAKIEGNTLTSELIKTKKPRVAAFCLNSERALHMEGRRVLLRQENISLDSYVVFKQVLVQFFKEAKEWKECLRALFPQ